jgi:hypothetical protein
MGLEQDVALGNVNSFEFQVYQKLYGARAGNLQLGHHLDRIKAKYRSVYTFDTTPIKEGYIKAFRGSIDFYNTEIFLNLTVESLLEDLEILTNRLKTLTFYLPDANATKEKIDNPLKILDFIKDLNNPLYYVESKYVIFDNELHEVEKLVGSLESEEKSKVKITLDFLYP